MVGAELLGGLPQCVPVLLHGRLKRLVVGAELLGDLPQCPAILALGRQNDLVVGARLLGGMTQCLPILLHDLLEVLPRALVEILATQVRVAVVGHDLEDAVVDGPSSPSRTRWQRPWAR